MIDCKVFFAIIVEQTNIHVWCNWICRNRIHYNAQCIYMWASSSSKQTSALKRLRPENCFKNWVNYPTLWNHSIDVNIVIEKSFVEAWNSLTCIKMSWILHFPCDLFAHTECTRAMSIGSIAIYLQNCSSKLNGRNNCVYEEKAQTTASICA